jgi:hypothetical protein
MPMETLEVGRGPEESRATRAWKALSPVVRRWTVVLAATAVTAAAAVVLSHTVAEHRAEGRPGRPSAHARQQFGAPPWAMRPREIPSFTLANRTDRRVLVSTPPGFVFTIPAHRRLLFARGPVCTYQSFTARFRHGAVIGTIRRFCSADRWVIRRSGRAVLR